MNRILRLSILMTTIACIPPTGMVRKPRDTIFLKHIETLNIENLEQEESFTNLTSPSLLLYHVFKTETSKFKKYQKTLERLKMTFLSLNVYQIDCDKYSQFCHLKGIEKYPTLEFRFKSNRIPYQGKLMFKKVYQFIKNHNKNAIVNLKNLGALRRKRRALKNDELFLLYVGSKKGMRFKIFEKFNKLLKEKAYYTFNSTLAKIYKAKLGDYFLFSKNSATNEFWISIFGIPFLEAILVVFIRQEKEKRTKNDKNRILRIQKTLLAYMIDDEQEFQEKSIQAVNLFWQDGENYPNTQLELEVNKFLVIQIDGDGHHLELFEIGNEIARFLSLKLNVFKGKSPIQAKMEL